MPAQAKPEAVSCQTVASNVVKMELLGMIEEWRFQHDSVHILFRAAAIAPCCDAAHFWFVNREGRTRCCDCDALYVAHRMLGLAGDHL